MSTITTLVANPAVQQTTGPGTFDPYRPSEYTGLLLDSVQSLAATRRIDHALEMGVGCGVVLATLGLLGAARLRGVDVDADAVEATGALMTRLGLAHRATLSCGHLWEGLGEATFDVIVANLPQFPTTGIVELDRSPDWATGGDDGRALMDPFLEGLAARLRRGGTALITHSTIGDVTQTKRRLGRHGLTCRRTLSTHVAMGAYKAGLLGETVWERYFGQGLLRVGPYAFIQAQLLEITW